MTLLVKQRGQNLNLTRQIEEKETSILISILSIFDTNQQNKTRLDHLFYHRDVITIAKLKTWAPCG